MAATHTYEVLGNSYVLWTGTANVGTANVGTANVGTANVGSLVSTKHTVSLVPRPQQSSSIKSPWSRLHISMIVFRFFSVICVE
jgi:hypothetical protein